MAIKLETRDAGVEALHQDAVEAAQECLRAREEMLEAGLELTEASVVIDNLQMCMQAVEKDGLEGLKVLDCMGDLSKTFGVRMLKDIDAAEEGLGSTIKEWAKKIWEFIKKWWGKFVEWIKGLFSSSAENAKKTSEKIKKTKERVKNKKTSGNAKPSREYDNSGMSDKLNASLEGFTEVNPSNYDQIIDRSIKAISTLVGAVTATDKDIVTAITQVLGHLKDGKIDTSDNSFKNEVEKISLVTGKFSEACHDCRTRTKIGGTGGETAFANFLNGIPRRDPSSGKKPAASKFSYALYEKAQQFTDAWLSDFDKWNNAFAARPLLANKKIVTDVEKVIRVAEDEIKPLMNGGENTGDALKAKMVRIRITQLRSILDLYSRYFTMSESFIANARRVMNACMNEM